MNNYQKNFDSSEIKLLEYNKLNDYYSLQYFKFKNKENQTCIAMTQDCALDKKQFVNYKIYIVDKEDFIKTLEHNFAKINTHWAVNYLKNKYPHSSAKNISYLKITTGFIIIFFSTMILFINFFYILNNIAYFIQNLLKITLLKHSLIKEERSELAEISDDLPIYSILIPLYREEYKIKSILKAISNLNYPKNRLDVKLIIEMDDLLTYKAISTCKIEKYIHIIKVPFSLPRTKPKALNYAIPYVKGKYITIYDAEDIPDSNQLLKAVYAFNKLPEQYVCIQAKLNFYNRYDNLLTRLFSVEYTIWFGYLLRGLSILNLPIALGGTSNHFKADKLKEVGYWDPYNVTEDADLGIRLYTRGYKVYLIDSTTMEEAPSDVNIWFAQRSRWIKGYLQTLFVFMKMKKTYKKFGIFNIASIYILLGLSTYSFFCLPWLLIAFTLNINSLVYSLWIINSIFFFPYMYSLVYFIIIKDKSSVLNFKIQDWVTLCIWPLYFILHTIASYRAIWEIITSPFKWNKTPHGVPKDF